LLLHIYIVVYNKADQLKENDLASFVILCLLLTQSKKANRQESQQLLLYQCCLGLDRENRKADQLKKNDLGMSALTQSTKANSCFFTTVALILTVKIVPFTIIAFHSEKTLYLTKCCTTFTMSRFISVPSRIIQ